MLDVGRVHFTGAAGSGTTTLGRAVAHQANLTHFETDDYLWEPTEPPYQRMRPPAERLSLLEADLDRTSTWALSGSLVRWGDALAARFQLVVLVVTPTEIRLARLRQRELQRFGEALAPGGSMHRQHRQFLEWAALYDEGDESVRSLRLHENWLSRLNCQTLRVDGSRPISGLVREVLTAFAHR